MIDLTLYNARQSAYLEQTRDFEIESIQNEISYEFKSNPSYEQIVYNGNNKDVHVVDLERNFKKVSGFKKLLGYPNDVYNVGEYITLWNSTWMILSKDDDSKVQEKCSIFKCINKVKWYDDLGLFHEYPITIEKTFMYDLKTDKYLTMPDREIRILIHYDEYTSKIKWADVDSSDNKYTRFVINGDVFRVTGIDRQSFIYEGIGYLDIRAQLDLTGESDNLVDGIADDDRSITLLIQNGSTLNLGETQTVQINSEVTVDDVVLTNPVVTYISSDESIATVDSSGLVTAITSGNVTITASYSTASDSIGITISAIVEDNYTVDITSSNGVIDGIKLGQSLIYTSQSLNNGIPYTISGTWSVLKDDGITTVDSSIISALSNIGNSLSIKCSGDSSNVGTYFKVKYDDGNASETIRIRINSLWG